MNDYGSDISVCLLTYNHKETIHSTLLSILNQSISNYEIVISDDCSTDGTWELLLSLRLLHSNIRLIQTPKNLGMPSNANFAVSNCSRKYVALLHHDDIYSFYLLENWVELLVKYSSIGFVFNSYKSYDTNHIFSEDFTECTNGKYFLKEILLKKWGCVVRGTAMIRRKAWIDANGMNPKYDLLSDIDLWMKISSKCDVGYIKNPLISFRHEQAKDYPLEYSYSVWSWKRLKLLYDIHADNNRLLYCNNSLWGHFFWFIFKCKLNLNTFKWLLYAFINNRSDILLSSQDYTTVYDFYVLSIFRKFLITLFKSIH